MAHTPIWQSPKTASGRLFAAKVWDRLAGASRQEVSASVRDEFLAALQEGEPEVTPEPGPLAEDLARAVGET